MSLVLVLALQTAAAASPDRATSVLPAAAFIDWDLGRLRAPEPPLLCRASGGDTDVVVCARRRGGAGDFPLDYWARLYAPRPIRAEMDLGNNIQGRIHVDAVPMDRGAVSNRAMIGIRLPF